MSTKKIVEKLRRLIVRRGAASDDAEDIVQEAYARLEAYMQAHDVQSQEAFLTRAAININLDRVRRARRGPIPLSAADHDLIRDTSPLPDEIVSARERMRRARTGLYQLDPITRRCLVAQRLEGLTYAQIAAREQMSVAAVEKRVARAVHFLVKWVGDA